MATKTVSRGSTGKITIDHGEIKRWAAERNGKPARVRTAQTKEAKSKGRTGGILRIDFGTQNTTLEEISWDDFFKTFDDNNLAFLYQEKKGGNVSRFFKFVDRADMGEESDGNKPDDEEGGYVTDSDDGDDDEDEDGGVME